MDVNVKLFIYLHIMAHDMMRTAYGSVAVIFVICDCDCDVDGGRKHKITSCVTHAYI